jgi:hypothetical protein
VELRDDRLAARGVHDPVYRAHDAVLREALRDTVDVPFIDGEAVAGNQLADRDPRFQARDASHKIRVYISGGDLHCAAFASSFGAL